MAEAMEAPAPRAGLNGGKRPVAGHKQGVPIKLPADMYGSTLPASGLFDARD